MPYDLIRETRKLVEHTLLVEMTPVFPITGSDIIVEFDIKPGNIVAQYLERARRIYERDPCFHEELLRRLREHSKA